MADNEMVNAANEGRSNVFVAAAPSAVSTYLH